MTDEQALAPAEIPGWVERMVDEGPSYSRGKWTPDLTRCRASVMEPGRSLHTGQCFRKVKCYEYGFGWCSQHAPSAVHRKREIQGMKMRKEIARSKHQYRERALCHQVVGTSLTYAETLQRYVTGGDKTGMDPDRAAWLDATKALMAHRAITPEEYQDE